MKANIQATPGRVQKKRGQGHETLLRLRHSKSAMFGLVLLICMILMAIFAGISPYSPTDSSVIERCQTPSLAHWFGTDELGRDILTRIAYGARISLSVGLLSVLISATGGTILGAIAGFYGGKVDNVIMRFVDVWMAIPNLLLNISVVAALGNGLQNVVMAIGIASIPNYCRIIRGSVLANKAQEYVEASRASGATDAFIIFYHIIPNCIAPMIVQSTLSIGSAILTCSSLSFLGIGVTPPTPEWGSMLSTGRSFIRDYPHMTFFPGLATLVTILAMNLLGDGLRDALDPKLRN